MLWFPPIGRSCAARRLTTLEWRLILWAAVPLLFYTLSVGKQPRYILPVLPPLALLVARTLVSRASTREPSRGRRAAAASRWPSPAAPSRFLALAVLLYRARPLLFALSPPG